MTVLIHETIKDRVTLKFKKIKIKLKDKREKKTHTLRDKQNKDCKFLQMITG